jgi:hypothetical protein
MSSFCEMRVAPTPNVGEGAGVDDGMGAGAGAGVSDGTMVAIGTFVGEGNTGAAVTRGATVEEGVACLGKKSEQAIVAITKVISTTDVGLRCRVIKRHYIP